jgi:hypothetical protein
MTRPACFEHFLDDARHERRYVQGMRAQEGVPALFHSFEKRVQVRGAGGEQGTEQCGLHLNAEKPDVAAGVHSQQPVCPSE